LPRPSRFGRQRRGRGVKRGHMPRSRRSRGHQQTEAEYKREINPPRYLSGYEASVIWTGLRLFTGTPSRRSGWSVWAGPSPIPPCWHS
jgi:hypothetical protein